VVYNKDIAQKRAASMAEQDQGGANPQDKLIPQRTTQPDAERTGGSVPAPFRDVFGRLSETPPREDPAFWPVKVLNELNYKIVNREDAAPDVPGGVFAREIGERFAPMKEHIRQVKTAYEILAYPHCKYQGSRELIEDELTRDQHSFERDQVALNDAELAILSRLAAAKNIPFNPEKRVYQYDEVFHPAPDIEPALNSAEFVKWLGEQRRARQQEPRK
jgi:hypothetical protein